MNKQLSNEKPSNKTRLSVAGFIGMAVFSGVVGNHVIDKVGDRIHENSVKDTFDEPNVVEQLDKNGYIDGQQVRTYTIKASDSSPDQVATKLGAIDHALVSDEISGQVGGEQSMDINEMVAIPVNQLAEENRNP